MSREHMIPKNIDTQKPYEFTPKTKKQKVKNFWFYYKVHIITSVLAIFVLGYIFIPGLFSIKSDYIIALICFSEQQPETEQLEKELEKYAEDINGDGNIKVTVEVCTSTQAEKQAGSQNYFMMDTQVILGFETGDYTMLIIDNGGLENYGKNLKELKINQTSGYAFDYSKTELSRNAPLNGNYFLGVINDDIPKKSASEKRQQSEDMLMRILTEK